MSKLLRCMMMDSSAMLCGDTYTQQNIQSHILQARALLNSSMLRLQSHKCLDTSAIKQYPGLGGVLGISPWELSPLLPLSQELSCMGLHLLS